MADISDQTVAHINGGAGQAAQCQAQSHSGIGPLQALARLGQQIGRQCDAPEQTLQRQMRVAELAADINLVAHLRAAAQQWLPFGLAEDGDADVQRALGGVATDQLAAVGIGQREQAA